MDAFGIKINDKENGIWLPKNASCRLQGTATTAHGKEGVHGDAYRQQVYNILKDAKNDVEFLSGLDKIRGMLEKGCIFSVKGKR
jgi:hypothetical protein